MQNKEMKFCQRWGIPLESLDLRGTNGDGSKKWVLLPFLLERCLIYKRWNKRGIKMSEKNVLNVTKVRFHGNTGDDRSPEDFAFPSCMTSYMQFFGYRDNLIGG